MECLVKSCHKQYSLIQKIVNHMGYTNNNWRDLKGSDGTLMRIIYPNGDDSYSHFEFCGIDNISRKFNTVWNGNTVSIDIISGGAITNMINITGNDNTVNINIEGNGTTTQHFNIAGNRNTLNITFEGNGTITQMFDSSGKGNAINNTISHRSKNGAVVRNGICTQKFYILKRRNTISNTINKTVMTTIKDATGDGIITQTFNILGKDTKIINSIDRGPNSGNGGAAKLALNVNINNPVPMESLTV